MKNNISKANIELRHLIVITAITVFAVIFQFLSCCEDCPTCPEPEPFELGHYRLYSLSWDNVIYSIDIPADKIVDSIQLDYSSGRIYLTPDGDRLLVGRNDYDSSFACMEVYNTSDLSHIGSLNHFGKYYFDGSDNYGFLQLFDVIYKIDPTDFSILDTLDIYLPTDVYIGGSYLDTISNIIVVSTSPYPSDTTSRIYKIDCLSMEIIDSLVTPNHWGHILKIAYNWLSNELYFFGLYYYAWFYQYDFSTDSLISKISVSQATGSIAVSPDGTRIYMTDGGDVMHGEPPIHPIWIFNAKTHQPTHWIPPYDSSGWLDSYFGQIVPTPGKRRIYICGNLYGAPIIVVDLIENKIIHVIKPYSTYGSIALALGPVID